MRTSNLLTFSREYNLTSKLIARTAGLQDDRNVRQSARRVRRHLIRAKLYEFLEFVLIGRLVVVPLMIVFAASIIAFIAIFGNWPQSGSNQIPDRSMLIVPVILNLVSIVAVVLAVTVANRLPKVLWPKPMARISLLLVIGISGQALGNWIGSALQERDSPLALPVRLATILSGCINGLVIGEVAYLLTQRWYAIAVRNRYPDSIAIRRLHDLFIAIWTSGKAWEEPTERLQLVSLLESAAMACEMGFPALVRDQDVSVVRQTKKVGCEFASYLRTHKSWIITPMTQTKAELCDSLAKSITLLGLGYWHYLPRLTSPEGSAAAGPWREQLRLIIIALLPAFFLFAIEFTPLKLDAGMRTWATIVVLTWAVFGMLTAIDPNFSSRVTGAKSILDLFLRSVKGKL